MNINLETKAPEISTPSIASSAMLVELSISVWTANTNDKEAKKRLDAMTGAQESIHRVTKKLMGDHPMLDNIKKFAASTRTNLHYRYTLPWSDTGMRLLTTASYFDYHKMMDAARMEYEGMVDEFLDGYEMDVEEIVLNNSGVIRHNEFPTIDQLRKKFGFRINYMPMPEAGDFRLDVSNEAQRVLADKYADFYQRKVEEAMNSVWKRLFDAVTHVSERLADPEPGFTGTVTKEGRKKFSETLIEDMLEIMNVVRACNVTGDEAMQRAERRLTDALHGITTEAVKDDPYLRNETKREVDKVIADLPSLGW